MKQVSQGKISIHQGQKDAEELVWSDLIAYKEYNFFGELTEELERMTWEKAEKISGKQLDNSFTLLFRAYKRNADNAWEQVAERVLLYFVEEEKISIEVDKQ